MARGVLAAVLLAPLGVWVVELRRPHPESVLAPLARDLGPDTERVRLISLVPLHWREPAGYFHLLARPRTDVRFAASWQAVDRALDETGRAASLAVLLEGDSPLPEVLAGRLEPAGRYGDYRLLRSR